MDTENVSYNEELIRSRNKAIELLKRCKEDESKKDFIALWVDGNTTRIVSLDKIKRRGMEVIKVKIGGGRLVWMEKKVAVKNGYINEL